MAADTGQVEYFEAGWCLEEYSNVVRPASYSALLVPNNKNINK